MEKHLPEEFKFTGKWRLYQQKFLDDIKIHLDDKKLNVVAAPGAGKTTLGIEIVQRLKNPALILSPSITIKNQWKQRLVQSFLPENANADWVSTSIKNIAVITSTTYQAVHSVMKTRETTEAFIEALKQYGVKTFSMNHITCEKSGIALWNISVNVLKLLILGLYRLLQHRLMTSREVNGTIIILCAGQWMRKFLYPNL